MNNKATIVITDFSRKFWQTAINDLTLYSKMFIILEMDNKKVIQSPGKKEKMSGLVIEISGNNKLILAEQSSSNQENGRNISIIIDNYCKNICEIAIASHTNGGRLYIVDLPESKKYYYKEFHNESKEEEVWQEIAMCFSAIGKKKVLQNSEPFDLLWRCLAPKPSEVAHSLRSEILTPFIPFHLFHQLVNKDSSEWQNIFRECCVAIKNTEEKFIALKGLRKDISPDIKNCADEKFNELKKIFQKSENDCVKNIEKEDCLKTIEDFAQCLEKIVNCIESGEEASAKNK